nr:hypothetical protein [Tanacetum cinerariifolium]
MRPFGCPVTILNTLDPLGKFQRKVDEGLLVGYSVCSSGPAWLFDIDSLSQTMNYHPVLAENQSNPTAVSAAGLEFTNSTNDFTNAGSLVSAAELNFTNNTNDVSVAGPSNAAMPNLEDFSHNEDNVGAEADT